MIEMKNFSKYIQNKSFDEELHRVRKESMERTLTTEYITETKFKDSNKEKINKIASATLGCNRGTT